MSDIDINEIIEILQSKDNQKKLKKAIICELHELTKAGPKKKNLYLIADNTLKKNNENFTQLLDGSADGLSEGVITPIPIEKTKNNQLINELFKDPNFISKLQKNIESKLSDIQFNFVNARPSIGHVGGAQNVGTELIKILKKINGSNMGYTSTESNNRKSELQRYINAMKTPSNYSTYDGDSNYNYITNLNNIKLTPFNCAEINNNDYITAYIRDVCNQIFIQVSTKLYPGGLHNNMGAYAFDSNANQRVPRPNHGGLNHLRSIKFSVEIMTIIMTKLTPPQKKEIFKDRQFLIMLIIAPMFCTISRCWEGSGQPYSNWTNELITALYPNLSSESDSIITWVKADKKSIQYSTQGLISGIFYMTVMKKCFPGKLIDIELLGFALSYYWTPEGNSIGIKAIINNLKKKKKMTDRNFNGDKLKFYIYNGIALFGHYLDHCRGNFSSEIDEDFIKNLLLIFNITESERSEIIKSVIRTLETTEFQKNYSNTKKIPLGTKMKSICTLEGRFQNENWKTLSLGTDFTSEEKEDNAWLFLDLPKKIKRLITDLPIATPLATPLATPPSLLVTVKPYGVLGKRINYSSPTNKPPTQNTCIVDPAGLDYMRVGNITGAGYASKAIYEFLNLNDEKFKDSNVHTYFKNKCKIATCAIGQKYDKTSVIHVVGPNYNNTADTKKNPRTLEITDNKSSLQVTYQNIFTAFNNLYKSNNNINELRLLPVSSGVFATKKFPLIGDTAKAVNSALIKVPIPKSVQIQMCIYDNKNNTNAFIAAQKAFAKAFAKPASTESTASPVIIPLPTFNNSIFQTDLVDRIVKGLDRKPIKIELKVDVDGVDDGDNEDNNDGVNIQKIKFVIGSKTIPLDINLNKSISDQLSTIIKEFDINNTTANISYDDFIGTKEGDLTEHPTSINIDNPLKDEGITGPGWTIKLQIMEDAEDEETHEVEDTPEETPAEDETPVRFEYYVKPSGQEAYRVKSLKFGIKLSRKIEDVLPKLKSHLGIPAKIINEKLDITTVTVDPGYLWDSHSKSTKINQSESFAQNNINSNSIIIILYKQPLGEQQNIFEYDTEKKTFIINKTEPIKNQLKLIKVAFGINDDNKYINLKAEETDHPTNRGMTRTWKMFRFRPNEIDVIKTKTLKALDIDKTWKIIITIDRARQKTNATAATIIQKIQRGKMIKTKVAADKAAAEKAAATIIQKIQRGKMIKTKVAADKAAANKVVAQAKAAQEEVEAKKIELVIQFANEIIDYKPNRDIPGSKGVTTSSRSKYHEMNHMISMKSQLNKYITKDWCKSEKDPIWDKVIDYVYSETNAKGYKFFKDLVSKFIKPMSGISNNEKHNNPTYLFYRILLAKWRVKYRKTYTKNRKELPNYLNKYYKQCSHVKAAAAKAEAAAAAASTTTSTSTKKSKKTLQTEAKKKMVDAKKKLVDAMSMFSTNVQKKYFEVLFSDWNVPIGTLENLKTHFDNINNILKIEDHQNSKIHTISPIYRNNINKNITIIIMLFETISMKNNFKSHIKYNISLKNKLKTFYIPYIRYDEFDNKFKLKNWTITPPTTAASGGSKKTRTVTIKSNAMPKTVKGLQTKKKLLKKKIKKAEKKVKLSKDRIIRLK